MDYNAPQLIFNGLLQGVVLSLPALALTLVFAVARFPNAAIGDTLTVGGYSAWAVQKALTVSVFSAAIGSVLSAVIISLLSYYVIFRRLERASLVAKLLAGIGLAFVLRAALLLAAGSDPHTFRMRLVRGSQIAGVTFVPIDIYIALAAAATLACVFLVLHLTPVGRRMRALADNPDLARISGMYATRVMPALWALTGIVCGVAGVSIGVRAVLVPESGWELLLPSFAATVLGGIGSPVGAVLGALIFGVVMELAQPILGSTYNVAVAFAVLLLVLLVKPTGLLNSRQAVR